MSQLVRLEGTHTWQNAHCALVVGQKLSLAEIARSLFLFLKCKYNHLNDSKTVAQFRFQNTRKQKICTTRPFLDRCIWSSSRIDWASGDQILPVRDSLQIQIFAQTNDCFANMIGRPFREGCKKSKWKFKMAFAMKGGGVSRGSRVPHTYFEKWFFKNHLESFPDCENVFCT